MEISAAGTSIYAGAEKISRTDEIIMQLEPIKN